MPVVLILGGVAILYLLLENRNAQISADLSVGNPGATQPKFQGFDIGSTFSGGPSTGQKITNEIGVGVGGAVALAHSGVLGAGLAASSAIPIIGTLAAIGIGVISSIEKHHQAAIAAEGHALNQNDPIAIGDFVSVVQAAAQGQIDYQQAQQYTDQIVSDWYLSVRSIQKGKWTYQGSDLNVTHANSYASRSGPYGSSSKNPDSHAPDPCNGACVVGHYFIERGALITLAAVQAIQQGKHGSVTYPAIPPHDAQTGLPAKTVNF